MNFKFTSIFIIGSLCLILNTSYAQGRFKAKGTKANANGGVTSARGGAAKNKNGGGFARARGTTTNGQGQVAGGGATAVKGLNGGGGVRGGSFTADNSGNVNYQGGAAATGTNGTAATTGSFSRSQNGVGGSRSSTATANNGSTYQGDTQYNYDSTTGQGNVEHTQTCYDTKNNPISCPND